MYNRIKNTFELIKLLTNSSVNIDNVTCISTPSKGVEIGFYYENYHHTIHLYLKGSNIFYVNKGRILILEVLNFNNLVEYIKKYLNE